uniref:Uncharacterized protein n=1 Tax=Panagrolaimus sp. ES5 TaxID=591445 RepID=A0AC34FG63_9BILA
MNASTAPPPTPKRKRHIENQVALLDNKMTETVESMDKVMNKVQGLRKEFKSDMEEYKKGIKSECAVLRKE